MADEFSKPGELQEESSGVLDGDTSQLASASIGAPTANPEDQSMPLEREEPPAETSKGKLNQAQTTRPRKFKLFEAFLCHRDLLLYLATQHLEPQEFFTLYAISKPFHYLVNLNITSYILSSARRWARLTPTRPAHAMERVHHTKIPGVAGNPSSKRQIFLDSNTASQRLMTICGTEPTPAGIYSDHDITTILPYRCYGYLCSVDPAQRDFSAEVRHSVAEKTPTSLTSEPLDDAAKSSDAAFGSTSASKPPPLSKPVIRDVPTFRYLKFLLDRARTIQLIIHHLAEYGHRVPPKETPAVLARISLCLDIPTNARRTALFRNTKYWTTKDLFIANLFFMKVDMCFTDPVDGQGETSMRELLMSQRSLVPLAQTLARTRCTSLLETLRLYVRTLHVPSVANRKFDIFGVPAAEVGIIGTEGWGLPPNQFDPRGIKIPGMHDQPRRQPQPQPQSQTQSTSQNQRNERPGQADPQPSSSSQAETERRRQGQAASGSTAPQLHSVPLQRKKLLRPDELVRNEAVRRKLPLHHHYLRMISYGYLDPNTLEDLPAPEESRGKGHEVEVPADIADGTGVEVDWGDVEMENEETVAGATAEEGDAMDTT